MVLIGAQDRVFQHAALYYHDGVYLEACFGSRS